MAAVLSGYLLASAAHPAHRGQAGRGRSCLGGSDALVDRYRLAEAGPGGCMVTCRQTYSCGTGASAVNYQFQIVYTMTHTTWHSTIAGINNPLIPAKSVTMVNANKH